MLSLLQPDEKLNRPAAGDCRGSRSATADGHQQPDPRRSGMSLGVMTIRSSWHGLKGLHGHGRKQTGQGDAEEPDNDRQQLCEHVPWNKVPIADRQAGDKGEVDALPDAPSLDHGDNGAENGLQHHGTTPRVPDDAALAVELVSYAFQSA